MALQSRLHAFHRHILEPGRGGAGLALCRGALALASAGYGAAVRLRNLAYERGLRRSCRAGVPVVSVGNITAGGTGKTPFVAWLAALLGRRGLRPAVLSRGYGAGGGGGLDDENELLRRLVPGVPVVVEPDRVRGAERAVREHSADVLVLDDGFQHRRLARDLDIVLVDALRPFGGGRLLPLGLLREPPSGLARAHVIVLTRCDLASPARLEELRRELAGHAPRAEVATARHRPVGLRPVGPPQGAEAPRLGELAGGVWGAFCGLGNPEAFRLTLRRLGADIVQFTAFPDHHHYRPAELARLMGAAAEAGCRGLLTTEKDAVKLEGLVPRVPPVPLFALCVRMELTEGREALESRLFSVLRPAAG